MTKAGGARTIQQASFTPEVLARQIEAMAVDPVALNNAAARALSVGRPHAARDLADLVERVGNGVAPRRGRARAQRRASAAGAARTGACRHDEGDGHRHRHDPFRRHRRHRHVGHRRGDAPARLQGAGLGRRRQLCRREAAQGRHPGRDRPFADNLGDAAVVVCSSAIKDEQPGDRRRRPSGACRASGAPKCSPS